MDAEEYFRAALEIKELKLGSDDLSVAETLAELGVCLREGERPKEAEEFFWRALDIQEEKLGVDEQVAVTLHNLGQCIQEVGRANEAAKCFRRGGVLVPVMVALSPGERARGVYV